MNRKQNSLMRFSRTERLAQLSEQEIVIEKKKREIQAKIEAQKKKETEEALRKLESSKESQSNKFGVSKKSSWNVSENQKNKSSEKPVKPVSENPTNAFSNDGSFLDQFKKLSKSGLPSNFVDNHTLTFGKKTEELKDSFKKVIKNWATENEKEDSFRNFGQSDKDHTLISNSNHSSVVSRPSSVNFQLQLPGVLVPEEATNVSVTPSANNSTSLIPSLSVQKPQFQSVQNQFSTCNKSNSFPYNYLGTVPAAPTNQFSRVNQLVKTTDHYESVISESSQNLFPKTPLAFIKPPLPITPQNIPPPSPIQVQNIPPPSKPPKDKEILSHTECISLSIKTNTKKKLEAIPNPLNVDQQLSLIKPSLSFSENNVSKNTFSNASQNLCSLPISENVSSDAKEFHTISSAFNDEADEDFEHLNEECHHWAQLVAHQGDKFEDSLRQCNQSEQNARKHQNITKHKSMEMIQKEIPKEGSTSKKFFKEGNRLNCKRRNSDSDSCDEQNPLNLERLPPNESKEGTGHSSQAHDGIHHNKVSKLAFRKYCCPISEGQIFSKKNPENNFKEGEVEISDEVKTEEKRKRKRKSRWGDAVATTSIPAVTANINVQPPGKLPAPKSALLSQLTRTDPGLIQYARQTFGSTNLSEEDWKKAEDHYKINLLYQDMVKKRAEIEKLERQGKFKYEYDSDEDTEGGTWEHKLRQQEMQATQLWAEELTRQAAGKHHIGDFLPPDELERFMEKYNAVKEGREPDLSDYKEFKLKQDNVGYRLLQKMGWNEGQGLGQDGSGIQNPVNKATTRHENQGLGIERPDGLEPGDDEYDAYRKRMMLAYRFRPNPLNNPRRPYY